MKKIHLLICLLIISFNISAQSIGIGTNIPNASAMLDVKSFTKGILIPRTSTASRLAILNPAKGLMLYDTTTSSFWFHNGTAWAQIGTAANGWALTGNTATNPANNFLGTTDNLPLRFRLNNAWAGEIHPTNGNIFFGPGAGQLNTTATGNIAIGMYALTSQSFDNGGIPWESNNVAIGLEALYSNDPANISLGIGNTAVGTYAMRNNTNGYDNTALGASALYYNDIGIQNTGIGRQALFSNTSGIENTATGFKALRFNEDGSYNTVSGSNALYSNTHGYKNTAIGGYVLHENTIGNTNTAIGYFALANNTTASNNTAIGNYALQTQSFNNGGNEWESNNVAVGYGALFFNQPTFTFNGTSNTAIGTEALYNNITGGNNTGNGYQALYSNTDGSHHTAIGYQALYNNTGLIYGNTAIGSYALSENIDGEYNTAVGVGATNDLPSSNFNTVIGGGAHCSASNSVVIGYDAFTNTNNLALLGNPSTLHTGGYTEWTNFSDGRFKKDIDENVRGLDFIMRLRPVTYHMDVRGLYKFWGISPYGKEDSVKGAKYRYLIDDAITKKEAIRMSGFVAQEVEKAAIASGYDFDGVVLPTHDKDHYRIAYGEFVVPLVKAVQELSAQTTRQKEIIEQQQNKIELQQRQYEGLLKRIETLEKKN